LERKCGGDCVPDQKVDKKRRCAKCFQDQIIALHSCDDIYRKSTFVDDKCSCKKCMDENADIARDLEEKDLGMKVEDFIRISEPYCWHMDSIDAFTGTLAETSLKGGLQGPTNARLMALQFQNLKKGDRFFFTNRYSTTQTNQRGLESVLKNYVKKQSLATVICNNLKSFLLRNKQKWNMKMKLNPFLLESKWERCYKIIKDSHVNFNTIVDAIISGTKKRDTEEECKNTKQCQEKYKSSEYHCLNTHCHFVQQTCFTSEDCEDPSKECVDGKCTTPQNADCKSIGCTKPWHSCKFFGSQVYCVCKYSNDIISKCKRRP